MKIGVLHTKAKKDLLIIEREKIHFSMPVILLVLIECLFLFLGCIYCFDSLPVVRLLSSYLNAWNGYLGRYTHNKATHCLRITPSYMQRLQIS